MRKSDMISAETALKLVQDQTRLIDARETVIKETIAPISNRLRNNHIEKEFANITRELT